MFVILKPDAIIDEWLDHLRPYGPLTMYPRVKSESWVKEFYSHIPEEAVEFNTTFLANAWLIGVDLHMDFLSSFDRVAKRLRSLRVQGRLRCMNQIHIPDDQAHSDAGRKSFLNEIS